MTLRLDDELLFELARYARTRGVSLERAAVEAMRRGVSEPEADRHIRAMDGLLRYDVSADGPLTATE